MKGTSDRFLPLTPPPEYDPLDEYAALWAKPLLAEYPEPPATCRGTLFAMDQAVGTTSKNASSNEGGILIIYL